MLNSGTASHSHSHHCAQIIRMFGLMFLLIFIWEGFVFLTWYRNLDDRLLKLEIHGDKNGIYQGK